MGQEEPFPARRLSGREGSPGTSRPINLMLRLSAKGAVVFEPSICLDHAVRAAAASSPPTEKGNNVDNGGSLGGCEAPALLGLFLLLYICHFATSSLAVPGRPA